MLLTCYGCGLRVSELVALKVHHIDGERKLLRVEQGKGAKDRAVVLPLTLLTALRQYWQRYHPKYWLFPNSNTPKCHLSITSVQKIFKQAKTKTGIQKVGGIHSLRHAYATHQLENGLAIHKLQQQLGHTNLQSTLCYVHWVPGYLQGNTIFSDLLQQLGMSAILHTWGQTLDQHVHLHCLIPGGVINTQQGYTRTQRAYLYPERVLSRLFRGKMVSALRQAAKDGKLSRITRPGDIDDTLNAVMKKDWVIHTKAHIKKPDTVIAYLGRYTCRTAISLSRIMDVDDKSIWFKYKDYRDDKKKVMQLAGTEFLRRFLLHILPKGFMRVRHYGYLANRVRVEKIKQIRQSLEVEQVEKPEAKNSAGEYSRHNETEKPCPGCKAGYLHLIGLIPSEKERRQMLTV